MNSQINSATTNITSAATNVAARAVNTVGWLSAADTAIVVPVFLLMRIASYRR